MDDDRRAQLRGQLRLLAFAAVVVLAGGLASGFLVGRLDPVRAAGTVLSGFVVFEPDVDTGEDADRLAGAPTSGRPRGTVRCGVRAEPLDQDDQRATVAAGVTVVQHADDVPDQRRAELVALVSEHPEAMVLAPSVELDLGPRDVVLTAWLHRLGPQDVAVRVVDAFRIAHGGNGPVAAGCDEAAE